MTCGASIGPAVRRWRWGLALCGLLAVYLACAWSLRRFTGVDEVAFKAAGREWARTGRFAAPELAGFLGLRPPVDEIWLAQPPAYTALFGLWTRAFGFGPVANDLFDAAIHAGLVLTVFLVAGPLAGSNDGRIGFWSAVAILAIPEPGRPEELAAALGLAGIGVLWSRRGHPTAAAALLWLCTLTNPVLAVLFGAIAAAGAFALFPPDRRRVPAFVGALVILGTVTAGALLTWLPEGVRQFASHAARQTGERFEWAIPRMWPYAVPWLTWCLAGLVLLAARVAANPALLRDGRFRARWLVPGGLTAALIVAFPAKPYYLAAVAPVWTMAAASRLLGRGRSRFRVVRASAFAALAAAAGALPARGAWILATLPSSQRLKPAEAVIRRLVPEGSVVLSSGYWASLADRYAYRSAVHARPDLRTVRFAVLTGNGSGAPGVAQRLSPELDAWLRDRCVVVHDGLRRTRPTFLGRPISRSGWGFGPLIYGCGAPTAGELRR